MTGRTAMALDPMYPLHPPLLRFLLALNRSYPSRVIDLEPERPQMPEPEPWVGDPLRGLRASDAHDDALLAGKPALGVRGAHLESHGWLPGEGPGRRSQARGPRDTRWQPATRSRLRSAASETRRRPGREELQALIDAVPVAWPDIGASLTKAFNGLPQTKRRLTSETEVFFDTLTARA
jgi:hypothetical protein